MRRVQLGVVLGVRDSCHFRRCFRSCFARKRWLGLLACAAALRAAADRPDVPFVWTTPLRAPPYDLSLRSIFAPFADAGKLVPPFIKMTNGAGEPTELSDLPLDADAAVDMITRPSDPWSIVLRLEELVSYAAQPEELESSGGSFPLLEILEPVLPLSSNGTTAHIYMSGRSASALPNHTDVTEIIVLQLIGRKTWLQCREKPRDTARYPSLDGPEDGLWAKLDKCATYSPAEVADLQCDSVTTSPGDVLSSPSHGSQRTRARRGLLDAPHDRPQVVRARRRADQRKLLYERFCGSEGCDAACYCSATRHATVPANRMAPMMHVAANVMTAATPLGNVRQCVRNNRQLCVRLQLGDIVRCDASCAIALTCAPTPLPSTTPSPFPTASALPTTSVLPTPLPSTALPSVRPTTSRPTALPTPHPSLLPTAVCSQQ